MQSIKNNLVSYATSSPSKARSERGEYIDKFAARVNAARVTDGYKKLPTSAYAVKLSHLTVQDLHAFFKSCDQSASFSRTFWGSLKVRDYVATKQHASIR